jgi:hypothetical protein
VAVSYNLLQIDDVQPPQIVVELAKTKLLGHARDLRVFNVRWYSDKILFHIARTLQ